MRNISLSYGSNYSGSTIDRFNHSIGSLISSFAGDISL
jgi:hypothetical protein